jgi:hypothetical protein
LVTFKSILEDISDNDVSFQGGRDTLRALQHDIKFNFGSVISGENVDKIILSASLYR